MIASLFESFDPFIRFFKLNLLAITIPIIVPIFLTMPTLSYRKACLLEKTQRFIIRELSASLRNKNNKIPILWLLCVFFIILTLNIIGLLPYVYTITSQIMFSLSLALPFWLRFLLFASLINTSHFLSHLVPLSTPLALSQFITIIETIRQIIRPITLSVRLCANITAGHILIALRRKPIFLINWFSTILLILLILETAVAFIQRYVFTILLTIYLRETY